MRRPQLGRPVASAATKSEQAGGYKVAMTVTASAGGAEQVAMTGRGTFGQDEGELEVTLAGLTGTVLGGLSDGSGTDATMKAVYLTDPIDVWVDDQGYIRQYESSYDETLGGNTVSTTTKVELSDYRTQVDVSAPPADEVFDVTELATRDISSQPGGSTH